MVTAELLFTRLPVDSACAQELPDPLILDTEHPLAQQSLDSLLRAVAFVEEDTGLPTPYLRRTVLELVQSATALVALESEAVSALELLESAGITVLRHHVAEFQPQGDGYSAHYRSSASRNGIRIPLYAGTGRVEVEYLWDGAQFQANLPTLGPLNERIWALARQPFTLAEFLRVFRSFQSREYSSRRHRQALLRWFRSLSRRESLFISLGLLQQNEAGSSARGFSAYDMQHLVDAVVDYLQGEHSFALTHYSCMQGLSAAYRDEIGSVAREFLSRHLLQQNGQTLYRDAVTGQWMYRTHFWMPVVRTSGAKPQVESARPTTDTVATEAALQTLVRFVSTRLNVPVALAKATPQPLSMQEADALAKSGGALPGTHYFGLDWLPEALRRSGPLRGSRSIFANESMPDTASCAGLLCFQLDVELRSTLCLDDGQRVRLPADGLLALASEAVSILSPFREDREVLEALLSAVLRLNRNRAMPLHNLLQGDVSQAPTALQSYLLETDLLDPGSLLDYPVIAPELKLFSSPGGDQPENFAAVTGLDGLYCTLSLAQREAYRHSRPGLSSPAFFSDAELPWPVLLRWRAYVGGASPLGCTGDWAPAHCAGSLYRARDRAALAALAQTLAAEFTPQLLLQASEEQMRQALVVVAVEPGRGELSPQQLQDAESWALSRAAAIRFELRWGKHQLVASQPTLAGLPLLEQLEYLSKVFSHLDWPCP